MENRIHEIWSKFDDLAEECYDNLSGEILDLSVWNLAFGAFLEAISTGRLENPEFGKELAQLDDSTDYMYDIEGWLYDYISILEQIELNDQALAVCKLIIVMFEWKKESPNFFRFQVATILSAKDNLDQYLEFCQDWYEKEPDNSIAAGCLISAKAARHDLDGAMELVEKHYNEDMQCDMTNDTLFFAVELVYILTENQEAADKVHEKLEFYSSTIAEEIEKLDHELDGYTFVDDGEEYPPKDEEMFVSLRDKPDANLLS